MLAIGSGTNAAPDVQGHQSTMQLQTSSSAGRMSAMQLQALLAAQAAGSGRGPPQPSMHRSRSASAMSQPNADLLFGGSGPLGQVDLTSPLPLLSCLNSCPRNAVDVRRQLPPKVSAQGILTAHVACGSASLYHSLCSCSTRGGASSHRLLASLLYPALSVNSSGIVQGLRRMTYCLTQLELPAG